MDSQNSQITRTKSSTNHHRNTNTKVDLLNRHEKQEDHIHGHIYQLKLLMLFLYRGVQLRYSFRLGTEIKEAKKFDDIVFECENEDGRKEYLLLQAKHRLDERNKITAINLLTERDSDFSLTKYFFSYQDAKKEKLFKGGSIRNVIICTNIDFDFESLNEAGIGFQKINDEINILTVGKVENEAAQYRFKEDVSSLLKPILQDYYLTKLAKNLAISILANRSIRHHQESIFQIYHGALGEEVIDVKCKKFRENFVKNRNISESALKFRKAFVKEIEKQSSGSITLETINEAIIKRTIVDHNKKIGLNLSKNFGSGKLKTWPSDSISDDEIKEYLNCLVLAVNQPNEQNLGEIVKTEIGQQFDAIATENTYNKFFVRMIDWVQGKGTEKFLSYKDGKEFFEEAKRGLPIRFDFREPISSFTGRTEKLKELHEALRGGQTAISQAASMSGLGGVGKSELARKYASEYSQDYDHKIIWFNAENYQSLAESFRRLARDKLGIGMKNYNGEEKEMKSIVEEVYRFFSQGRSLFIFDNAEKRRSTRQGNEGIDQFLPSLNSHTNGPCILITSRNQKWGNIKPLLVDIFTEEEAVEFIKKALRIKDDTQGNDVIELAKKLQYFPLALHQAVAYISTIDEELRYVGSTFKISDYLEQYKEKTKELLNFPFPEDSDNSYTRTTFLTWEITIENIKRKECGPEASEILDISAYFVPDGICTSIFLDLFNHDKGKLGRAIRLLKQYSMVNSGQAQTLLNIHRLVQQVARIQVTDQNRENVCLRKALELFKDCVNPDNVDQAVSVWEYASKHKELVQDFRCIPAQVIEKLRCMFRYREAYLFGKQALRILENELGPNDYQCSVTMKSIGIVLFHQGKYDDALKDLREVRRIHGKQILVDDTIGLILKEQGEYEGALAAFRSIVKTNKSLEDGLRAIHNIALVLIEQEKYNEASEILNAVLKERKFEMNPDHEDISRIIYSMGLVLDKQKRHTKALEFFEDALEEIMKSVTPDNRTTILTMRYGIAEIRCNLKQYERSYKILNEVLQEREKLLPDHSCTLETRYMMVLSLLGLEKKNSALQLLREISDEFAHKQKNPVSVKTQTKLNLIKRTQLRRSGFDVTILDRILCLAAGKGYCEIIPILLNNGADINAPNALLFVESMYEYLEVTAATENNIFDISPEFFGRPLRITKAKHCWKIINKNLNSSVRVDGILFHWMGAPLHFAAWYNQVEALHALLNNEANINVTARDGFMPLHYAAYRGNFKVVRALLTNGADSNATTADHGCVPLHQAANEGHLRVVCALLDNGANVNATTHTGKTPLNVAAGRGHSMVVHVLLNNGAYIHATDHLGNTPLHDAADAGHSEVVHALLNNGANVNATLREGIMPLHYAASRGHLEVVNALLNNGANINGLTANDNCTPLHDAANGGHVEVVNALLNNNANVDATDSDAKTPLHVAVDRGALEVVYTLLNNGANVNATVSDGNTPLHYAAYRGHLKIVHTLLRSGANVNDTVIDGNSSLHYAASRGYLEVVHALLNNGANINAANTDDGCAPLHDAANGGHSEVVHALLNNGANVDVIDSDGMTPLHVAAGKGHLAVVHGLLNNGANVDASVGHGRTPLHYAASRGHIEVVHALLNDGANINAANTDNGCAPLHDAANGGHSKVVHALLNNGANVDVIDSDGMTPLHVAARKDHLAVVHVLLNNGANVDAPVGHGRTSLHYAASRGNIEVVRALLNNGANVDATNIVGITPLYVAARRGYLEVIHVLLSHRANIDATDNDGITPLHVAAGKGYSKVVQDLLNNGANVNATACDGITPLHYAASIGHSEVVELLVNNGANVGIIDSDGTTPLHVAAGKGHLEVVHVLLNNGANVDAPVGNGRKPLHYAASRGHVEVVHALLNNGANVSATTCEGMTPLDFARARGHLKAAHVLLNNGANANTTIAPQLYTMLY